MLQIELQAARQNSDRNFLRISSGKYKFDVFRRLLQSFQHGIESRLGEHVDFINDVNLVTGAGGSIERVFQQFAHLVHLRIGSGVHLDQIDETPAINFGAGGTYAARRGRNPRLAIERLGQNAGNSGFADTACARKQVGMVQPFLFKRVGKRPDHMILSGQLGKDPGAPFAGKDLSLRHDIEEVMAERRYREDYCRLAENLNSFCGQSKGRAEPALLMPVPP